MRAATPMSTAALTKVAVLDDDIQFIRLVERILRANKIAMLPVTTLDIDEAVRVVRQSGCQAAVVDVYMYGSAVGFTLVERLRSDPKTARMPIVVASGARREVGRHVGFLQEHGCSVLLKPFDMDELIPRLRGVDPLAAVPPEETQHRFSLALHRITGTLHGGAS